MLALDLGTTTGWALRAHDGLITSGTVSFRPSRYDGGGMRYLRFTNWLTELDQLSGPIAAIWYEEVRRHVGTDAAHVYGGLMATLTALGRAPRRALPGRAGRHHQEARHRQGQRRQGGDDRRSPRARVQPEPTTTRRTRSPSCSGRSTPGEACGEGRGDAAAGSAGGRPAAPGLRRSGRVDGGGRRALVDHARPAGHRRRRWCSA